MKAHYIVPATSPGFNISRRKFLQSAAALTAMAALPAMGAGWYGKSDLWRLIQVTPVEVVAICDVDKQMLAGALEIASQRQKSKKEPRGYADYREMLKEKDLDIV